jgi:DNA mismatch repair ATPase MutS
MFLYNAAELEVKHYKLYRVLQILLLAAVIFSLGCGMVFQSDLFVLPLICIVLVNLIIYAVNKEKYEVYLAALSSLKDIIVFAKMITTKTEFSEVGVSPKVRESIEKLDKLTRMIGNFQLKKTAAFSGDAMDIMRDYAIGITLWDFTVYRKITALIAGKLDNVMQLFAFVGQIDMDIAVASFQESVPYYCAPTYTDCCTIQMEEAYHPLLDDPVSNDLKLEGSCIITGSNASGKSTFIKAVAINAILAQNIRTCMAKKFEMPPMQIVTSMTVRDDITEGESYYIKELHYLKRVVEEVDKNRITLCIIDEILRGTNTQERLAASEAILTYIAQRDCIVIVATHDMELAESMHTKYRCLHFCNYIREGNIVFDYKIYEGMNETTNALKLLEYIGFPDEIVTMAEHNLQESESLAVN